MDAFGIGFLDMAYHKLTTTRAAKRASAYTIIGVAALVLLHVLGGDDRYWHWHWIWYIAIPVINWGVLFVSFRRGWLR